jgi:hypothetical protein
LVCFVGYSINDPVLRYMMDALAADRMLAHFIRLKAGLCRISDRTTPSSSSEGHNSRADLGRDAVNALEVADAGSRGFAPRRLWPGLLKFERNEAEQLGFRAA